MNILWCNYAPNYGLLQTLTKILIFLNIKPVYKLSIFLPFAVLLLLDKPIQATFNLILYLGFIFSVFFISWQQGVFLYAVSVLSAMLMIAIENRNKKNQLIVQAARKVIHE